MWGGGGGGPACAAVAAMIHSQTATANGLIGQSPCCFRTNPPNRLVPRTTDEYATTGRGTSARKGKRHPSFVCEACSTWTGARFIPR
jgi:hypothetical protein